MGCGSQQVTVVRPDLRFPYIESRGQVDGIAGWSR